jgi:hypothetical protein
MSVKEENVKQKITVEPQPLSRTTKADGFMNNALKEKAEGKQLSWSKKPDLINQLYDLSDVDALTDEEDNVSDGDTASPSNVSLATKANASGSGNASGSAAAATATAPNNQTVAATTTKPKN